MAPDSCAPSGRPRLMMPGSRGRPRAAAAPGAAGGGPYAEALYEDEGATLDELREAVTTLEETERTARRVLGGDHPLTVGVETSLRNARAVLAFQEGVDASSVREALRKAKV